MGTRVHGVFVAGDGSDGNCRPGRTDVVGKLEERMAGISDSVVREGGEWRRYLWFVFLLRPLVGGSDQECDHRMRTSPSSSCWHCNPYLVTTIFCARNPTKPHAGKPDPKYRTFSPTSYTCMCPSSLVIRRNISISLGAWTLSVFPSTSFPTHPGSPLSASPLACLLPGSSGKEWTQCAQGSKPRPKRPLVARSGS